ncbi:MAG: helix-turn-helix domain-containing protein [Bacteroidia bacterium]|nr:helix-turn-helix domain-containing protein [Bacteroidia bacterium]
MRFKEFLPSKQPGTLIRNFWKFDIRETDLQRFPFLHESLPENTLSIVLIKRGAYMGIRYMGIQTKKFQQEIFENASLLGIRIHPWIISPQLFPQKSNLLNITAAFTHKAHALEEILQTNWEVHEHQLIEEVEKACLTVFQEYQLEENELVKYLCLLLEKGQKVKEIVEELPLSIRSLQKLFKSITGISMKQYQDIARIRKTTIDLYTAQKDRFDILYTNGFFDQSHFINDFKRRMDRSPRDFLKYHNSFEIDLG